MIMEKTLKICLFILFVCCSFVELQESSNLFPLCSRRYPDIGECISKAFNKLRPNLVTGRLSPEYVIKPLDPFLIPRYRLSLGLLAINFYDVYITRLTRFNLKGFRAYFDGDYLKYFPYVEHERLNLSAKFSLDGFVPIPLIGEVSLSFLDVIAQGNGSVHIIKRDGIEYFEIEQAKLNFERLKVGDIKISLLSGKSIRPGPVLTSFLNSFDGIFQRFLYKVFEPQIDVLHLEIANSFVKDIPVSYYFSD